MRTRDVCDGGEVGSFNTEETLARAWAVGRGGPAWLLVGWSEPEWV